MNICIIGAGITGLTIGRLLSKRHNVVIYEKESQIGGIARTKNVNGIAYHTVGGHCFNSKNRLVLDFVFNEILPKDNWHEVKRIAKIYFKGHYISYPIEFSIREIAKFDIDLAYNILKDIFASDDINDKNVTNLADWFRVNFGKTLAESYFIPYNEKIWGTDLSKISTLWVNGKLPIPNKREIFSSIIEHKEDNMPHNRFFYPNSNNQNTFIESLAKGLKIVTDFPVTSIKKLEKKWVINNRYKYDIVISTMPLNELPFIVEEAPSEVKRYANMLKYRRVTTVLWKSKPITFTWTYYPSKDTIFHRHIHIGNFFTPKQNYTITEAMGAVSFEEMLEHGKKFDYLIEPLDYHLSEHAYVVYDENYTVATNAIKEYLKKIGLFTAGRFGEWTYYNMDNCIETAFRLVEKIDMSCLIR